MDGVGVGDKVGVEGEGTSGAGTHVVLRGGEGHVGD